MHIEYMNTTDSRIAIGLYIYIQFNLYKTATLEETDSGRLKGVGQG